MSCCGKHLKADAPPSGGRIIKPSDECAPCAEKHLSTAYALAQESGYETPNRQRIVGELVACQWHLHRHDAKLAEAVRDIRHLIQRRREAEVVWAGVLEQIDALAAAEALKENGAEQ